MERIPENTLLKISDFLSRFKGNSKRFVVAIFTQKFAFNISGAFFFLGLGCSLKWWYKDQLLLVLLKQNLPAFSEPQQKISWETGQFLIEEQTCAFVEKEKKVFTNASVSPSFLKSSTPFVDPLGMSCNIKNDSGITRGEKLTLFVPFSCAKQGMQHKVLTKNTWNQNFGTNIHSLQLNNQLMQEQPLTGERMDIYSDSVIVNFKTPWQKNAYHRFVGIFPELARPGTLSLVKFSPKRENGTPNDCNDKQMQPQRLRSTKNVQQLIGTSMGVDTPNESDKNLKADEICTIKEITSGESNDFKQILPLKSLISSSEKYIFLQFPKNTFGLSARGLCFLNEKANLEPTIWSFFAEIFHFKERSVVHSLKLPLDIICKSPKKQIQAYNAPSAKSEKKDAKKKVYHSFTVLDIGLGKLGGILGSRFFVDNRKLSKETFSKNLLTKSKINSTATKNSISDQVKSLQRFFSCTEGAQDVISGGAFSHIPNDLMNQRSKESPESHHAQVKAQITSHVQQEGSVAQIVQKRKVNQEKLSYPLNLTKSMSGWQPPIETLTLSCYLDEIPYKLESTLLSFFGTKNLSATWFEICAIEDCNDFKPKTVGAKSMASETNLVKKSLQKTELPHRLSELFEIKQLLKDELQFLVNSFPLIFVNENQKMPYFACEASTTKKKDRVDCTSMQPDVEQFSTEVIKKQESPNNFVNFKTYPENASLYSNFFGKSGLVDLPVEKAIELNVSGEIKDFKASHEIQNHLKDDSYIWSAKGDQGKNLIDYTIRNESNLTNSFKSTISQENNILASQLSFTPFSHQYEYCDFIDLVDKNRSKKKANTSFNYLEKHSSVLYNKNSNTIKDFNKKLLQNYKDPLVLLNRLGITFNNLSFLRCPPVLLPTRQNASYWVWNKDKVKNFKIQNKKIATSQIFYFDSKTLTWQIVQQLNSTLQPLIAPFSPFFLGHEINKNKSLLVKTQPVVQSNIENDLSIGDALRSSTVLTVQSVQPTFRDRIEMIVNKGVVHLFEIFDFTRCKNIVDQNQKRVDAKSSFYKTSASNSYTYPINKIILKQNQSTIEKIDNINPVDNLIKLTPKKVKFMSGYIYPDMQNNFLQSHFYRWIQFKSPKFFILPPLTHSTHKFAFAYYTTQSEKKNSQNHGLYYHPSVFRKRLQKTNRFLDNGCLIGVQIPILSTHAIKLQQWQHKVFGVSETLTFPIDQINRAPLSPYNFTEGDKNNDELLNNNNSFIKKAAFPLLQNKATAMFKGYKYAEINRKDFDATKETTGNSFSVVTQGEKSKESIFHVPCDAQGQKNTSSGWLHASTSEKNLLRKSLETQKKNADTKTTPNSTPFLTFSKNEWLKGYSPKGVHWKFDHHLAHFPGFPKPNQFTLSLTQLVQGNDFSEVVFPIFYDALLLHPEREKVNTKSTNSANFTRGDYLENAIVVKDQIDCSPRKTAYRGIVAQRDDFTKDFQSPKTTLKIRSMWGTIIFGPDNPLTDRQSHFFGQRRLSTLDLGHFQRDYLRQLGKDTLLQSNSKSHAEYATSVNRVKILSFSKSINSFLFKKRKYAYLLKDKDQWHLLFQEQLRSALEDSKKYPPLTPEQVKEYGPNRIKVSAPLILARFPRKQHSYKVLANVKKENEKLLHQVKSVQSTFPVVKSKIVAPNEIEDFKKVHQNQSNQIAVISNGCTTNFIDAIGTIGTTSICNNYSGYKQPRILPSSSFEYQENKNGNCEICTICAIEDCNDCNDFKSLHHITLPTCDLLSETTSHYPQFTETYDSPFNSTLWLNKSSLPYFQKLQNFTQERLNANSWLIISQWSFLVALLVWVEQTFLGDIFPALSTLEQLLLGATGIKSGDRTHVLRISKGDTPKFKDIAGIDGLLGELAELVLFLRGHKERLWNKKTSYGVLLTGPPGTGKTFLVRALANEAKVPVLILSAGTLTANKANNNKPSWSIRHAFRRAKQLAPCILFIDEIDALGKSRGKIATDINEIVADTKLSENQLSHQVAKREIKSLQPLQPWVAQVTPVSNEINPLNEISCYSLCEDEIFSLESTSKPTLENTNSAGLSIGEMKRKFGPLTQLLVSMDGVKSLSGVLIMGATNRFELLDPALTRPGRFERIIRVEKPAEQKRIEILQLYSRNLGFESTTPKQRIPWSYLANRTVGLTAADLAVAMNYSSLKAILQGTTHTIETIEYGLDSIARFSHTSSIKNKRSKLVPYFFDTRSLATFKKQRLTKSIEIQKIYQNQFFIDVIHSTSCKNET